MAIKKMTEPDAPRTVRAGEEQRAGERCQQRCGSGKSMDGRLLTEQRDETQGWVVRRNLEKQSFHPLPTLKQSRNGSHILLKVR